MISRKWEISDLQKKQDGRMRTQSTGIFQDNSINMEYPGRSAVFVERGGSPIFRHSRKFSLFSNIWWKWVWFSTMFSVKIREFKEILLFCNSYSISTRKFGHLFKEFRISGMKYWGSHFYGVPVRVRIVVSHENRCDLIVPNFGVYSSKVVPLLNKLSIINMLRMIFSNLGSHIQWRKSPWSGIVEFELLEPRGKASAFWVFTCKICELESAFSRPNACTMSALYKFTIGQPLTS